jgi:EcsC protein family
MQRTPHAESRLLHKALATASGAAGGAFGLASLPVELSVTTIIMLRSIADIARGEGEDLSDPESALSCVQVFALRGRTGSADASQRVRGMLAKSVTEAARFIAERGVIEEGAPVLVRFIALVASRFGVVVTQKVAAQTLLVVGALSGAAVNYAFIEHFQEVARGHFTVRRLERVYGKTLYGRNMSALLRTNEAQLSQVRAGVSGRLSCIPTDTTKERVLMQHFRGSAPRERPILLNPVQDGNLKFRNVGLRVDLD